MAPTLMVARLTLVTSSNTVSSGTITRISGMNFRSQQSSRGSASANPSSGQTGASAGNVKNAVNQEQVLVIKLKQESNAHDMADQIPV